ncbi:MORC family CW-type zinc finger protein 3-like isoform X8 [Dreissena polymorpha]|uniref:MORC family CW-type zinc finger protein 3-like isoform X8 n=1 Tax=Dreissena polymorpha TaxID=45954 RepID=UPI0022651D01|nr:MORC family CW-type zinc finger protein 3-like isoform X8 [Dreissena polymorpha]
MTDKKELSRAIAMATDQTEVHAIDEGIQPSKISPWYLHSNSTSHTWVFSAIAELIDNACDANASELKIDKREIMTKDCLINPKVCLTLLDNGKGMTHEELSNMLSFGFSMNSHNMKIGKFGNGSKAGSMRIGDDAMVFTRCKTSTSVGLLSQTYLKAIKAKTVIVPIVTWTLQNKNMNRESSSESDGNLSAILEHGLFSSEEELMQEMQAFDKMKIATGTKIVIFNVRKDKSGKTELDFSSDPIDIRNPETALNEKTLIDRPVIDDCPEYRKSLREYCSILYLKPRMRIVIQGRKVQTKLIDKSLLKRETDVYNPTWLDRPVRITFGFTKNKDTDAYGLMLYHKNRLIDAYRKVGCQKNGKGDGIGVIGVVAANFLDPTQNKQEFINDQKYITFMVSAAVKLKDYYYQKTNTTDPNVTDSSMASKYTWVQCDNCNTWRRLPAGHTDETLSDIDRKWFCRQNPDVYYNRCDIPEEPEDEGEKPQTTYKKTYKKAMAEKQRKTKFEELRRMKEKEALLARKEQMLQRQALKISQQKEELAVSSSQDCTDRKLTTADLKEAEKKLQELVMEQTLREQTIQELEAQKRLKEEQSQAMLRTAKSLGITTLQSKSLVEKVQVIAGQSSSTVSSSSSSKAIKRKSTLKDGSNTRFTRIKTEDVPLPDPDDTTVIDLTFDENEDGDFPPESQLPETETKSPQVAPDFPASPVQSTSRSSTGKSTLGAPKLKSAMKSFPPGSRRNKNKAMEVGDEISKSKDNASKDTEKTVSPDSSDVNAESETANTDAEGATCDAITDSVISDKDDENLSNAKISEDDKLGAEHESNEYTEIQDVKPDTEILAACKNEVKTEVKKAFADSCVQTVPTVVKFASPEEVDLLKLSAVEQTQALLEKARELDETKNNLTSLRNNICQLLKIIVSDFDYGEPENIEKVILEFIQANETLASSKTEWTSLAYGLL